MNNLILKAGLLSFVLMAVTSCGPNPRYPEFDESKQHQVIVLVGSQPLIYERVEVRGWAQGTIKFKDLKTGEEVVTNMPWALSTK